MGEVPRRATLMRLKLHPGAGMKGVVRRKSDSEAHPSVLVLRLGQRWLALPPRYIAEVVERRPVHRVPHRTGAIVEGVVNLRGELVMAVSLEMLFGWEGDSGRGRRMLVVRHATGRFVFSVDEVYAGVRYLPEEVKPVAGADFMPASSCIRGVFEWDGRSVGLLNAEALIQAVNHRMA